ncbi:vegetative incompatibility protein HET-E-1 [Cladorrhinum sp. PSN259]|nr:vegetative incompatibility protein HET-E-1 [Cladorrhinum sp. PSN259]
MAATNYDNNYSTIAHQGHNSGTVVQNVRNDYLQSDFLPTAEDAAFDSNMEEHNAQCHPDTRTELLGQIQKWANDPQAKSIFWLNGMAGTGKSTISRTVAQSFKDQELLGASFFFKRGGGDRGKATLFFPTIASQLVRKIPALKTFIREAIDADSGVARKALKDQFEKLILQPLGHLHRAMAILIVVDALDECDGDKDVKTIISLLAQAKTLQSVRLRIFITSRPELPIRLGFKRVQGRYQDLVLHQISELIIERDISVFLTYELARIRDDYNSQAPEGLELPPDWPDEYVIRTLTQMAIPLFIFAATVCRFVEDPAWSDPANQLEKVLQYQTNTHDSELDKLDATYLPVLNQLTAGRTNPQKSRLLSEVRDVIGPVILLAQPLSVSSLARLLNIPPNAIYGRLNSLHSVLSIPSKTDVPVTLFHLSFRDFLVDPTKRANEFWINEIKYHKKLAERAVQLMSQHLKRDICGLEVPGKLRSQIDQQIIDKALLPEVQYACQYWVYHLKKSKCGVRDGDQAHRFLELHLLHWLEALSLLGRIPEGMGMVKDLLALADHVDVIESQNATPRVVELLNDAEKFVFSHRSIMERTPLQIYGSAVVFSPAMSEVRSRYWKERLPFIEMVTGMRERWGAHRQTLEGHSGLVTAVVFSPDGNTLASASNDNTVRMWDVATGAYRYTLKGHNYYTLKGDNHSYSHWVVAFSPDSNTLASASDSAVMVWDAVAGTHRYTLEGHNGPIKAIAFSPDGNTLASAASKDEVVRLWDITTGAYLRTLVRYSESVKEVAFSPDRNTLASSGDHTIQLWDIATGAHQYTLKGHSHNYQACVVAFSPDSNTLVSASGSVVMVWDAVTGTHRYTLEGYKTSIIAVVFSPDSNTLASASSSAVVVCDTVTGTRRYTLEGHNDQIKAIAFSPDGNTLASSSIDKTIRFWDAATGACRYTLEGHNYFSKAVVFSPDGNTLASSSIDNTIQLWNTVTSACQQMVKGHYRNVNAVAFSLNGNTLASASDDKTVRLWDAVTGTHRHILEEHNRSVEVVVFSPDGNILASISSDKTIRLWDIATGTCQQTLKGHSHYISVAVFSLDGKILASGSVYGTVRLWDTVTGLCRQTLKGHNKYITAIAFSPDGNTLASASYDETVRLWDVATSIHRQKLTEYSSHVTAVAFSPDGNTLASASLDHTVLLWDIATGGYPQILTGHSNQVNAVAFSPDGNTLASASHDKTVRLWDIATGACQVILEAHSIIKQLSFSSNNQWLETDRGLLSITSYALNSSIEQTPASGLLFVGDEWVMQDGRNLLWLPVDFRESCVAVHGRTLVLGNGSGRVAFFRFSFPVG